MRFKFDENTIKLSVALFLVILCSMIAFFVIFRFNQLKEVVDALVGVFLPFIYGLIMAYLLCPIYNAIVRNSYSLISRCSVKIPKPMTLSKAVGTVLSLLLLIVVLVGIIWMIVPGLIESIIKIIEMLPASITQVIEWVNVKLANYPEAITLIDSTLHKLSDDATEYVMNTLLPEYSSIAISISEGVIGILNIVKNLFIAIIICAYFLNIKEIFAAQMKKLILALFKENTASEILSGAAFTNKTFGGFINGKLIDSAIIGIICFIFMSIFGWEYTLLISCIIGITNIIPFFGPFIGAVPSALLLLMVEPKQCMWFLVFVLCLQQFDGNILGPKILGETTGIASFWVLFAVLVGGGLFGFAGMLLGIPIFVVIYTYIARAVNKKLDKKGFSTDLKQYKNDKYREKKIRKRDIKKAVD